MENTSKGFGIACFILGLLSILFLILSTFGLILIVGSLGSLNLFILIFPITSVVLGFISLIYYSKQKKIIPTRLNSAGLVLSIIGIVFSGLIIILICTEIPRELARERFLKFRQECEFRGGHCYSFSAGETCKDHGTHLIEYSEFVCNDPNKICCYEMS
jgi:hypothetical protein